MAIGNEVRYHQLNACFCCGDRNPHSMGMRITAAGSGTLAAEAKLTQDHEGAHGNAHGGAVSALFDELLGCLAQYLGMPAMTASLTVDYRAPIPLPASVTMQARCDEVEGRKLWVSADMRLGEGLVAEAHGLWIRRPKID